MIDAHAHLDFDVLHDRLDAVIAQASKVGVEAIVTAGYDHAHRERVDAFKRVRGIYSAPGLHPWAVAELDAQGLQDALDELVERVDTGGWCAIGECGLDYHRVKDGPGRALQRVAFVQQLALATSSQLPAIVHAVQCHDDALAILERHAPSRGVQLHGYSGHPSLIARFAAHGAMFSFGTPLTWRGQRKIKDALRQAVAHDSSCWMLETDAPDRPVAQASGEGLPGHLAQVVQAAAEVLGWEVTRVRDVSAENARRFFDISEVFEHRSTSDAQ